MLTMTKKMMTMHPKQEGKWLMPCCHMRHQNSLSTVPRKQSKNENRRMEKSTILWSPQHFARHRTTQTQFNEKSGAWQFAKNFAT